MMLEKQCLTDSKAISDARGARSLRAFSEMLGVSYGSVFQWEKGETRPSIDRIKQWIASENPAVAALGKSLFDLRKSEAAAEFKL